MDSGIVHWPDGPGYGRAEELEQQSIDPIGLLVLHPVRRLRNPFEPAVVAESDARAGRCPGEGTRRPCPRS